MVNRIMATRSKIVEISRSKPKNEVEQTVLQPSEQPESFDNATILRGNDVHSEFHIETAEPAEDVEYESWEDSDMAPKKAKAQLVIASFLTLIGIAWTGFFVWANQAEIWQPPIPARITELVGLWAIPAGLIGLIWLLALRHSKAEASRFSDVAHLLRTESELLESKMRTVNGEIAIARAFLAENAQEIDSIGRQSAKRLSASAAELASALADADQKAHILAQVSTAAVSNLEQLRNHLPVVTSAAKDVTNQIGTAGRTAQQQIEAMIPALQNIGGAAEETRHSISALNQTTADVGQNIRNITEQSTASLIDATGKAEARTQQMALQMTDAFAGLQQNLLHVNEEMTRTANVSADAMTERLATLKTTLDSCLEQIKGHLDQATDKATDRAHAINEILAGVTHKFESELHLAAEELDVTAEAADMRLRQRLTDLRNAVAENSEQTNNILSTTSNEAQAKIKIITDHIIAASDAIDVKLSAAGNVIVERTSFAEEALASKLSALSNMVDRVTLVATAQDERLAEIMGQIDKSLIDSKQRITDISDHAGEGMAKIAFAMTALSDSSGDLSSKLAGSTSQASALLNDTEKLMLALDTAQRELDDGLPAALERLEQRFATGLANFAALREETAAIDRNSAALSERIASMASLIDAQREAVEKLLNDSDGQLSERRDQIEEFARSLGKTKALVEDISASANQDLLASLENVRKATEDAAQGSRAFIEKELSEIGDRLSEQNQSLLSGAVDKQVQTLNAAMSEAITRSLHLSEQTTQNVADQMRSINEMADNLERRLADAREQFDGLDDEGFARRTALLTESLNSAAIDVAKILSNEVTDTAWAAYLKGDRGVFTRRAVKLLDSGESKIIAQHYDEDPEFRNHVNRYIHDFESMMRVLLSTRDGNAIGITMLSSDVGKLYVALAQAIERLRS